MTLLLGQDKKTQLIMFTQINAAAPPAHTHTHTGRARGTASVCERERAAVINEKY